MTFRLEKTSEKKALWENYKKFYIAQSTAFITPILYIFLNEKFGLDTAAILKISASYWLLSIIFQLPCGILADRFGVKQNLYLCLGLQVLSCLFLISTQNPIGYHLYLVCVLLAESLSASASSVLIRKQFSESEDREFKEFSFKLQNSFYLMTSLLLVLSAYLFTWNPYIPFILQILNFFTSAFFLSKIPEKYISNRDSTKTLFRSAKKDIYKAMTFLAYEKFYVYLLICLIFFGLSVSINHKVIQIQLSSILKHDQIVLIGLCMAVGNLFSSIGAKAFYSYISKRFSLKGEITTLILIIALAYFAMSVESVFFIILGFMLLNLFKGCYRPLLNSEIINAYPFSASRSTHMALTSVIVTAVSAFLQYGFASFMGVSIQAMRYLPFVLQLF